MVLDLGGTAKCRGSTVGLARAEQFEENPRRFVRSRSRSSSEVEEGAVPADRKQIAAAQNHGEHGA